MIEIDDDIVEKCSRASEKGVLIIARDIGENDGEAAIYTNASTADQIKALIQALLGNDDGTS